LAAGVLNAMMRGLPETECVSAGFAAAAWSLQSSSAVPEEIPHPNIPMCAEFTLIYS
jgi:sugar/nucleoside kinase (ribokinase family)